MFSLAVKVSVSDLKLFSFLFRANSSLHVKRFWTFIRVSSLRVFDLFSFDLNNCYTASIRQESNTGPAVSCTQSVRTGAKFWICWDTLHSSEPHYQKSANRIWHLPQLYNKQLFLSNITEHFLKMRSMNGT